MKLGFGLESDKPIMVYFSIFIKFRSWFWVLTALLAWSSSYPGFETLEYSVKHVSMFNIFRCQGACVAAIKPQYLMEPHDFKLWKTLLEVERQSVETNQMTPTLEDEALEEEAFEAVSKRAWSDILLQIFKVGAVMKNSELLSFF